jgi:pyridoxine/pyridoxamine 5'-phosphate oxidase
MTLATANARRLPTARIVLHQGLDARGFVFFTNYESRKGRRARREPARGAGVPLARGRAAGAHRGDDLEA